MTPHFSLAELTYSATAKTLGIDNAPAQADRENLAQLASLLEQVRHVLGGKPMTITSGYRCAALNKAVGGSKTSAHSIGLAADFTCAKFGDVGDIVGALLASDLTFDQLIEEHDGGKSWVHIGLSAGAYRREVLMYKNGKYTQWGA